MASNKPNQMVDTRVALDWTPNTLHIGLLVAKAKGFYHDAGLNVTFVSPDDDDYAETPAKKLVNGKADLAICPSETIIAYAEGRNDKASAETAKLQAIFALLDEDASAIISVGVDGVKSPKDLDGKTYGSYNARYEDDIVRTMIRNDGGQGQLNISQDTAKLSLFDVLIKSTAKPEIDATWIFSPWEGIKAQTMQIDHVQFRMKDYGIPYGYSPVLAIMPRTCTLSHESLCKFVAATKKAYQFARDNHDEVVGILVEYCPSESKEFLSSSLQSIVTFWAKEKYGYMEATVWTDFLTFLKSKGLVKADIHAVDLYKNYSA